MYEIAKGQGNKETFESSYTDYLLNDYKVEVNDITAGIHLYIKMRKRINIKS